MQRLQDSTSRVHIHQEGVWIRTIWSREEADLRAGGEGPPLSGRKHRTAPPLQSRGVIPLGLDTTPSFSNVQLMASSSRMGLGKVIWGILPTQNEHGYMGL